MSSTKKKATNQLSHCVHIQISTEVSKNETSEKVPKLMKKISKKLLSRLGSELRTFCDLSRQRGAQNDLTKLGELFEDLQRFGNIIEVAPCNLSTIMVLQCTDAKDRDMLMVRVRDGTLQQKFRAALVTTELKEKLALKTLNISVPSDEFSRRQAAQDASEMDSQEDTGDEVIILSKGLHETCTEYNSSTMDQASIPKAAASFSDSIEPLSEDATEVQKENEDHANYPLKIAAAPRDIVSDMAMMAKKQRISSAGLLMCPVCFENMNDLRMLPCEHSVCVECLQGIISVEEEDGEEEFRCPTCRHPCNIPREGAEGLPKNIIAVKLTEILAVQFDRRCKNWSSKSPHLPPSSFCFSCDHYLCTSCFDDHRRCEEWHEHQVVLLENDESGAATSTPRTVTPTRCPLHKNKIIDLYCTYCNDVACEICIDQEHFGHTSKKIEDVAIEFSRKVNVLFERGLIFRSHIDKLLGELQESGSHIESSCSAAVKVINRSVDALCNTAPKLAKTIREKQSKFVDGVESERAKATLEVNNARRVLESHREKVLTLQNGTEAVRCLDHCYKKVTKTLALEEELEGLESSEVPSVSWEAKAINARVSKKDLTRGKLKKTIGNLSVNKETTYERTPERVVPVKDPVFVLPLAYEGEYSVCGFTINNDSFCVLHHHDPHIWCYDIRDPEKDTKVMLPGLESPVGVVSVPSDQLCLVITDTTRKIHVVTLSADLKKVLSHRTVMTDYTPGSITKSNNGHLIVANSTRGYVMILDNHCRLLRRVPIVGAPCRSLTFALATDSGFLVVDSGDNAVFWINNSGFVKHSYRSTRDDDSFTPRCVAEDNKGRIVLADFMNDCIHLVGPDHTRLQHLVASREGDPIHRPGCVHLDADNGFLAITHGFKSLQEIRIYNYPAHHLPLTRYSHTRTRIDMRITLNKVTEQC